VDRARRWQRVSDDLLTSVVSAVAVTPGDGREVYAALGDANYAAIFCPPGMPSPSSLGIYRSAAGGDPGTWVKVSGAVFDRQVVYRLRVDPAPPHRVYVAASGGVYVGDRDDQGRLGWSRLDGFDAWTTDLAVDLSTNPRALYAGAAFAGPARAAGVWKHDAGGWRRRDSGINIPGARTIALGISASRPKVIYAKVEASNGWLLGIYKSETGAEVPTGGGNAWRKLALNPGDVDDCDYHWYNSVIEVDPSNSDIAYAGGLNIWRTPDGGKTWTNVSANLALHDRFTVHADQHAIAFDPADPKVVYLAGDGGLSRSTDMSKTGWYWEDISHGMVITEFYYVATQNADAPVVAGGAQDNGSLITFGNRTWYYNPTGDGAYVALDPGFSSSLYASTTNDELWLIGNPVPFTKDGGQRINWSSLGSTPAAPLAADHAIPGALLATEYKSKPGRILKTTDGVRWVQLPRALPSDTAVRRFAIGPSSNFRAYYMAVYDSRWPAKTTGLNRPEVWRTFDGGGEWSTSSEGLPADLLPNALAVDEWNFKRAYVALGGANGGGVYMTTDGGDHWNDVSGAAPNPLPRVPVLGLVIHPKNRNLLFAATTIGVFRGRVAPGDQGRGRVAIRPTAVWDPFDDGLPEGVDVSDICVNRATGVLTIGTRGCGAYQRDINFGALVPPVMLTVRDSVYDRALAPSQDDMPDPEHPVRDAARPDFFRPNDGADYSITWFRSPDIRVQVPGASRLADRITSADQVEMMSCPLDVADPPGGMLVDSSPRPGKPARVYVQVTNFGVRPASNVRVVVLWCNDVERTLPDDFWTTTLPEKGDCGSLATASPWRFLDAARPSRTIPVVNPAYPEVAQFDWEVPADAKETCAIMALILSDDDPIDPRIRATNEVRPYVLVPLSQHVALRSVKVQDQRKGRPSATPTSLVFSDLGTQERPLEMTIAGAADARERPLVALSRGLEAQRGLKREEALSSFIGPEVKLHSMNRPVAKVESAPGFDFPEAKLTIFSSSNRLREGTASQVTVLIRRGGRVVGGYTVVNRKGLSRTGGE
jgi:photosystem II stability/assembly factor-like uncharacterized protein